MRVHIHRPEASFQPGERDGVATLDAVLDEAPVDPTAAHDGDESDHSAVVTRAELARRVQRSPLPLPIQNPRLLPLGELDPEVLERVAAEIVSRRDNRGVQFYGRRGQSQYGLDIVEVMQARDRALYQVRRLQTIEPTAIRQAVVGYAGPPRGPASELPPRRFNATRFVVITSADLDRDTANVDELAKLQDEYAGDLDIAVWGAEALSRMLRDMPHLVGAVFGSRWAEAFCGTPVGPSPGAPAALGLVEDPVDVLGLSTYLHDAAQEGDPAQAARLYGLVATELAAAHFPGHAAALRRKQAGALRAGGDLPGAFDVLFELAKARALGGSDYLPDSLRHEVEELGDSADNVRRAKASLLGRIGDWYEHGSRPVETVAELDVVDAGDPDAALLCCLVLEQAIVDGLYDFDPPFATFADVGPPTAQALADLRALAGRVDSSDVAIRARLRCALADSALTAASKPEEVEAAFGSLAQDASAGRFQHAGGLVLARAARAFAEHHDAERAENLWRAAIIASSERGLFGDVRAALRALHRLAWESGRLTFPADVVSALPNRERLLASSLDPVTGSLEASHNDKLPDALAGSRRFLWETRLSGHAYDEGVAATLLADILARAGQAGDAVVGYVAAGAAKKAAEVARGLAEPVDVRRWLAGTRRNQAAAAAVIGAQVAVHRDEDVEDLLRSLIDLARNWPSALFVAPVPELDTLKAIAVFGARIPATVVDALMAICAPGVERATRATEEVARVLVNTYWAVEARRAELAGALGKMLELPNASHDLWPLVRAMPPAGRAELRGIIEARAEEGDREAVMTLAAWGEAHPSVQRAAREAAAAWLRRPVGIERNVMEVGTEADDTATLVLALTKVEAPVDVPASELTADRVRPAGGLLYSVGRVATVGDVPAPESNPQPAASAATEDDAARTAAGAAADVAAAVALHFMAVAEDHYQGAAARAGALNALRRLLKRLPADLSLGLVPRLVQLHDDPNLGEDDLFKIDTDNPLSRTRIRTGGGLLAAWALSLAAEALLQAHEAGEAAVRAVADQIAASASGLLRHTDRDARVLGARALSAVARIGSEWAHLFNALLFHGDERVRVLGIAHAPVAMPLFAALAADASPHVRGAVARRARDLPTDVRAALSRDGHHAVRHALQSALKEDG